MVPISTKKKITKQKLTNNDVITIGKHTLQAILDKKPVESSQQDMINDTMMLTTEKHKQMLQKQKKIKPKK